MRLKFLYNKFQGLQTLKQRKSPGNDGLTHNFKNTFDESSPILLGVYDFWDKFDTVGVKCVVFKKGDKKDIVSCRLISLLNLDYEM